MSSLDLEGYGIFGIFEAGDLFPLDDKDAGASLAGDGRFQKAAKGQV
jgi:hypothetical protein